MYFLVYFIFCVNIIIEKKMLLRNVSLLKLLQNSVLCNLWSGMFLFEYLYPLGLGISCSAKNEKKTKQQQQQQQHIFNKATYCLG